MSAAWACTGTVLPVATTASTTAGDAASTAFYGVYAAVYAGYDAHSDAARAWQRKHFNAVMIKALEKNVGAKA